MFQSNSQVVMLRDILDKFIESDTPDHELLWISLFWIAPVIRLRKGVVEKVELVLTKRIPPDWEKMFIALLQMMKRQWKELAAGLSELEAGLSELEASPVSRICLALLKAQVFALQNKHQARIAVLKEQSDFSSEDRKSSLLLAAINFSLGVGYGHTGQNFEQFREFDRAKNALVFDDHLFVYCKGRVVVAKARKALEVGGFSEAAEECKKFTEMGFDGAKLGVKRILVEIHAIYLRSKAGEKDFAKIETQYNIIKTNIINSDDKDLRDLSHLTAKPILFFARKFCILENKQVAEDMLSSLIIICENCLVDGMVPSELLAKVNGLRLLVAPDDEQYRKTVESALSNYEWENNFHCVKMMYENIIFQHIRSNIQRYFTSKKEAGKKIDSFITGESSFAPGVSFVAILREWNSYTPTIPAFYEPDKGGGYYLRHDGQGIVVDPGYDFIEHFHNIGGVLSDINHVVITHAHDDHTAQFESLLMLAHRLNKEDGGGNKISLYMNVGSQKKFSGLINLRSESLKYFHVLSPVHEGVSQSVQISSKIKLSPLPAFHDDVISTDTSVGLLFEFDTGDKVARIVFTGDSGLYKGDKVGPALFQKYHDHGVGKRGKEIDLLIAHLGSIQEYELSFFGPSEDTDGGSVGLDSSRWFYENHLGLLGVLAMIDQLQPKATIVSEFGAELRGAHLDIVDSITAALYEQSRNGDNVFVIPGDISTVYRINDGHFLCHGNIEFEEASTLGVMRGKLYRPAPPSKEKGGVAQKVHMSHCKISDFPIECIGRDDDKAYLFKKDLVGPVSVERFFSKYYNSQLPIHKKQDEGAGNE